MKAMELLLVQSCSKMMPRGAARSDGDGLQGPAVPSPMQIQQPPNAKATPPVRKAHVKSPSKAPQCLI